MRFKIGCLEIYIWERDVRKGEGIGWVKSFLRFLLRSMTVQLGIVRFERTKLRRYVARILLELRVFRISIYIFVT